MDVGSKEIAAGEGRYCRGCGYDLRGSEGICSECGRRFQVEDRRSYLRRPKRGAWVRWVRRAVVGLVVLGVLLGGSWGWLYWGWRSEQSELAALKIGWVVTEPVGGVRVKGFLGPMGWVLDRVTQLELLDSAGDGDLAHVRNLRGLRYLDVYGPVTDGGLEYLKDLRSLETLDMQGAKITGSGLVYLKVLPRLQDLYIGSGEVTDAGLASARELHGLQMLNLTHSEKLTDAGLKHLKTVKGLLALCIGKTAVTDAGLEELREMNGLDTLDLTDTNVTEAGVARLQRALPGLRIEW